MVAGDGTRCTHGRHGSYYLHSGRWELNQEVVIVAEAIDHKGCSGQS
jgi:hypothetical protein